MRDMAHLPLLSGWREIAGFPRPAKCGSEFFPCLSALRSLSFSLMLVASEPTPTRPPQPQRPSSPPLSSREQWIKFPFLFRCFCDIRLKSLILRLYYISALYFLLRVKARRIWLEIFHSAAPSANTLATFLSHDQHNGCYFTDESALLRLGTKKKTFIPRWGTCRLLACFTPECLARLFSTVPHACLTSE